MHFDPAAEVIASLQTSAVQAGPLTTTLRDLGLSELSTLRSSSNL
jgi:hypothetical protein